VVKPNRDKWLRETIRECEKIFALDNHSQYVGLGDHLLNALMLSDKLGDKKLIKFALEEHPACGTLPEALRFHQLDSKNLAERILRGMSES
jgi:transketolase C-terminal domain/subunit